MSLNAQQVATGKGGGGHWWFWSQMLEGVLLIVAAVALAVGWAYSKFDYFGLALVVGVSAVYLTRVRHLKERMMWWRQSRSTKFKDFEDTGPY